MDPEHLRQTLPRWLDHLRRHLHYRLGCRRAAADIAQEAGARLLTALARGEEFREPRAWLFRVGHNLAVDEVRRRTPQSLGLEWQALVPDPRSAEEEAEPIYALGGNEHTRSELLAQLPAAMGALSASDRRLLLARYMGGRSCMDLARADGVSEDASKVRLHRARRRLHALIERAISEPQRSASFACAAALTACVRTEAEPPAPPSFTAQAALVEVVPALPPPPPQSSTAANPRALLAEARAIRATAMGRRGPARQRALELAAARYELLGERWPKAWPELAEAYFRRGEILRGLERDAEARGAFLQAVDASDAGGGEPWGVRALLELGRGARVFQRRLDARRWYAQAEAREGADLHHRNDARQALAELACELAMWEEALRAAHAWRQDAESAAEEAKAAGIEARALHELGRERESLELAAHTP